MLKDWKIYIDNNQLIPGKLLDFQIWNIKWFFKKINNWLTKLLITGMITGSKLNTLTSQWSTPTDKQLTTTFLLIYLLTYLPTNLFVYLPIYLLIYLPPYIPTTTLHTTNIHTYPPTYLPTNLIYLTSLHTYLLTNLIFYLLLTNLPPSLPTYLLLLYLTSNLHT